MMTLSAKLVMVLGGVALVLSLLIFAGAYLRNDGRQSAIRDVAAQDKGALDAVDKARDSLAGCRASGGVWDRGNGACNREGGVPPVPSAGSAAPGR